MDDTLLNRDISDNPSGMYSSEMEQNKKSRKNSAFYGNYLSSLMTEQFNVLAAKYNEILDIISNMWLWRI